MDDVAEMAVVCQLRRRGFSLQRVRKIMKYLQRELGKRLAETVTARSDYNLLTDGRRTYLENSAKEVIDILKNSKQPMLAVCLSDTVREIHAEIRTQAAPARSVQGRAAQAGRATQTRAAKRKSVSSRPFSMGQRAVAAKRRAMS